MNTENRVTHLEELPNELFFQIFSYLKSDMIIQTFLNLNQRCQSLILQFARHLVLSSDIKCNWIKKYMSSIENEVETITLTVKLIASVFSSEYSYPNLRWITLYLGTRCQIELYVENESHVTAIVSSLYVLSNCSINLINEDFQTFKRDYLPQLIGSKLVMDYQSKGIHPNSPCSAIRRINMSGYGDENLQTLCGLAPEMTYLKIRFRLSSVHNPRLTSTPNRNHSQTQLTDLYIKVIDRRNLQNARLLIEHCQRSLKRIELDLGEDLIDDGQTLEALLTSCTSLENFSFISQFSKKKRNISDIIFSFQSEWWLDTQRPSILIHEINLDRILAVSIPCSFSNILKDIPFSTDFRSWHLNKGKLDSILIGGLKTNQICFSSKQPISLDFLRFAARIFESRKQILACRRWGLMSEQKLFEQVCFSSSSIKLQLSFSFFYSS